MVRASSSRSSSLTVMPNRRIYSDCPYCNTWLIISRKANVVAGIYVHSSHRKYFSCGRGGASLRIRVWKSQFFWGPTDKQPDLVEPHKAPRELQRGSRATVSEDAREDGKSVVQTSTQIKSGNWSCIFNVSRKYSKTVIVCPSPTVNVRSLALSLVNFLTRRFLSGSCARYGVMTFIPEMNCWRRSRSASGRPCGGSRAFGVPGLPRNSSARSINFPDLYIALVEVSTLISMRSIVGRTD